MNESRGEFSVPIELAQSANLQEVRVVIQTQSHYENRSRSSKQHLFRVSLLTRWPNMRQRASARRSRIKASYLSHIWLAG